ncbi:hypothetical protein G6L37_03015 [Agrobacterium rubi]|nr:hypothetical protein [Agrobacterium rubi]NTF24349.1 hypothetical protein [Agrobacterium rubi]
MTSNTYSLHGRTSDAAETASFSDHLRQIADTTYGMTAEDYARALVMVGFEPLFSDSLGRETLHVYGRAAGGLLLTFDTFHKQRNCASIQFRTTEPIWIEAPAPSVEDIVKIDRKTSHVRLDAREKLFSVLSVFEQTSGFLQFWGNAGVKLDICDLTLEQDAAVALREGVSPRDMSSRLREVNSRRLELMPREWRDRWDLGGSRTSADARTLSVVS